MFDAGISTAMALIASKSDLIECGVCRGLICALQTEFPFAYAENITIVYLVSAVEPRSNHDRTSRVLSKHSTRVTWWFSM